MMVRLLASPLDTVIGQDPGPGRFATPNLLTVPPVIWPPFGHTERYMAGAIHLVRHLHPLLIEVHNRANLALDIARALPGSRVTLFLHNDPQGMRRARTPRDRATLLRTLTVAAVSRYLRDRFMEGLPANAGTVHHLPNAIDLAALPPPLPPDQRDPVILFVGRVVANKGADAFIRAVAAVQPLLPGWRATIIGADRFHPGAPDTFYLRAIRPHAEAAGIDMPGYLPHPAVLQAMARAAIVVVPSRWQEPFGLTALEAAASGAALICSPFGGLPEAAGPQALYTNPDESGALEAALLALAQNPARRAAQFSAGRAHAQAFAAPAARARLQALRRELVRTGVG
jgi:glycosyltransferase involved in cell wall biosynthesis